LFFYNKTLESNNESLSETKYVLNSKKNVDEIRNRILAERQKGIIGKDDGII
jgi:hypothetical protein